MNKRNFSIKFFKFLGIVFWILCIGVIQTPKAEAVTSVGDFIKIKLGTDEAQVYEGYDNALGTADTFEIPAGTTFYQPGATRYECALLLTNEDGLACDDDGIVWVEDGVIIGTSGNSLSADVGAKYVQCCNNGSPACAKDFDLVCGFRCMWVEGGGDGAQEVFTQTQPVTWDDECSGLCSIYPPAAGAARNYEILNEYLCAWTWQLCDAPGTCFSYGGKNYACGAVNYWTECTGATPSCVAGACVAAATCDTDPTVEIIPVSQNGVAGTALNYTIRVTNNDDAACVTASRTFNLSSTRPGGWPPDSFSAPNITAAKGGGSGSVTYTLTSPVGAAELAWNFTITASDASGANTANGIYTVTTCDPAIAFIEFEDDKYRIGSMLQISYAVIPALDYSWCIYDNIGNLVDDGLIAGPDMAGGFNTTIGNALGIWTAALVVGLSCPAVPTGCIGTTKVVECLADADCASLDCDLTTNTCAAVGPGPGPGACANSFCEAVLAAADIGCLCGTYTVTAADVAANGWCCSAVDWVAADKPTCQAVDPACAAALPPPLCGNGVIDIGETCDASASPSGCVAPSVCNAICNACVAAAVPPPRCDPKAWVYCNPLGVATISEATEEFLGYVLGLIGSVALLFIIIAGLMYMTSAGSEDRIATSKRILTGAVIGLGVALLAYSLLQVIITVLGM